MCSGTVESDRKGNTPKGAVPVAACLGVQRIAVRLSSRGDVELSEETVDSQELCENSSFFI